MNELILFVLAAMLLTITPGPDNLFILAQGLGYGKRAALFTAWGMCSGIAVHTLAAAIGLSALLRTSAVAYGVLKWAGAAYLLYVAWTIWRDAAKPFAGAGPKQAPAALAPSSTGRSDSARFLRGFLMNVLNPKVALFFLAFFPQFLPANDPHPVAASLWLGALFFLQALVLFTALACATGPFNRWLNVSGRLRTCLLRTTAAGLGLVAARLAFSKT